MQTYINGSIEIRNHNAINRTFDVSTRVRPDRMCYRAPYMQCIQKQNKCYFNYKKIKSGRFISKH